MTKDYGIIGLGNMGHGMASNLRLNLPATTTLWIHDTSPTVCTTFLKTHSHHGPIRIASTPHELATNCHTIITMLPADPHVRSVYFDPATGIVAAPRDNGRVMIDSSTIDPKGSLANGNELREMGAGEYIDAPVSGGVHAATGGFLSFMIGRAGPAEDDVVGGRVFETLSMMGDVNKIRFCGGPGLGLVAKIAANYICISNLLVATEGMALGVKSGIDARVLYETIQDGAGQSWVMQYEQPVPGVVGEAPSSEGYRRAFTAGLGVKDLRIGMEVARRVGVVPSVGKVAVEAFERVKGDERTRDLDHSSLWLHVTNTLDEFAKMKAEKRESKL